MTWDCGNSEGGRTVLELRQMPKDLLGRTWALDIHHTDRKGCSLGSSTIRFRTEADAMRYIEGMTG